MRGRGEGMNGLKPLVNVRVRSESVREGPRDGPVKRMSGEWELGGLVGMKLFRGRSKLRGRGHWLRMRRERRKGEERERREGEEREERERKEIGRAFV